MVLEELYGYTASRIKKIEGLTLVVCERGWDGPALDTARSIGRTRFAAL